MGKSFARIPLLACVGLAFLHGNNSAFAHISDDFLATGTRRGRGRFDVFGKIASQKMSVNLSVPTVIANPQLSIFFNEMDMRITRQDFAVGSIGITGALGQRFGWYAEVPVSRKTPGP